MLDLRCLNQKSLTQSHLQLILWCCTACLDFLAFGTEAHGYHRDVALFPCQPSPRRFSGALPPGQGLRPSLISSINLAQMSEFSLVIASLGLAQNTSAPSLSGL